MDLRAYDPSEAEQVRQLLRAVWGEDQASMGFFRYGAGARTLLVHEGPVLTAAGSIWRSRFHPGTCYLGLQVHPGWQGRGIGRRLLEALADLNAEQLPLQTAVWESRGRTVRFLERNGFAAFRRTYEPVLPLAAVDVAAYAPFAARVAGAGYSLRSLAELGPGPSGLPALCREAYVATHRINPPGNFDLTEWERVALGGQVVLAPSVVAVRDGQLAAFSLAHPHDEPGRLALGWRGVAATHLTCQKDLIAALTLRQIEWAAANGYGTIEVEADTTDPWAMLQLELFPFGPAPAWVSLRRSVKGAG